MKKLSDYLHLYVGCEFIHRTDQYGWSAPMKFSIEQLSIYSRSFDDDKERYKFLLRPLSDMTEAEMHELFWFEHASIKQLVGEFTLHLDRSRPRHGIRFVVDRDDKEHFMSGTLSMSRFNSEQVKYLLSKSFDLFGLIESGLAIDSSTLTKETEK